MDSLLKLAPRLIIPLFLLIVVFDYGMAGNRILPPVG
jgi:hypothetical protein